jgi:hypothetical protein
VALAAAIAALAAVFAVAVILDPYDAEGIPLRSETHRQLGLPECTFKTLYNKPCPSCGLTTSFSLLLHGDVLSSIQANSVGTLLACFLLLVLAWAFVSLGRNRLIWIRSLERALTWTVAVFLVLLLVRWAFVVL